MKKEELVQLHLLLLQFKQFCEEHGIVSEFSHYHQLEISPLQVHRSKEEHKRAIFVLVTELVASLTENSRVPRVYTPGGKGRRGGLKASYAVPSNR